MSCLIKMCLDGDSKSYEYNRAYIDICIYDDEVISFPDAIIKIKSTPEETNVTIDRSLVRKHELLTESIRLPIKKEKKDNNVFCLNLEKCKLVLYPDGVTNYLGQKINVYAILIWHLDQEVLRLIDRSCKF